MVVGYKNEWENSQFYAKNEIKQKSSNFWNLLCDRFVNSKGNIKSDLWPCSVQNANEKANIDPETSWI